VKYFAELAPGFGPRGKPLERPGAEVEIERPPAAG